MMEVPLMMQLRLEFQTRLHSSPYEVVKKVTREKPHEGVSSCPLQRCPPLYSCTNSLHR
jgi:hypothetical protein